MKIAPTDDDLRRGLRATTWTSRATRSTPGCSYEEWSDEQTDGTTATTYARVVSEPGREGLAVQYWLYYPFNDFTNKHESDWEMVQVEFAASDAATALTQEPTRVGYSQHEGVEVAQWGDVKLEVVDGTHPVVHPAAGLARQLLRRRPVPRPLGPAGVRLRRHPRSGFRAATRGRPRALRRRAPSGAAFPWLDYTGRWGQREKSFYNGPTGPNTKDQWTAPLTWTDAEGVDTAYAVPASGLFGTQATGAFCGIVASGSDVLRATVEQPAWAALALGALAALIAWLVAARRGRPPHRCGWPAGASTGQVLSSVWRMYLRHVPLFAGIGLPIAVATLLPGVATVWMTSTAESLDGNQASTAPSSPSPGWRWSSCPRSPSRSARRPRWSPSGGSTGSPGGRRGAPTAAPCGAPSRCC